ncbi:MAG: hypothetical protein AAGN82_21320 [Myxococcota bacterium]
MSDDGNPFGRDLNDQDPLAGATKCPHCGAKAKTSANPELGAVCNVCGAPRIDVREVTLSGKERKPLIAARDAMRSRTLWRVAALFGTVVSVFGLGVTAMVALFMGAGAAYAVGGISMALPWILLAAVGYVKAKGETKNLEARLSEAWRSAARDVVAARPSGVTASGLAETLQLDEAKAEEILAELSIDDMLQSRITDEGGLVLAPSTMLRIDQGATGGSKTVVGDPLEERFLALEEAMAEEEASEPAAVARTTR